MPQKRKNKRICFVSLSAYPLLVGKDMDFLGGAEVRLVRLAREVLRQGLEVSFITHSDGGEPVEYADGIKIIKVYQRSDVYRLPPLFKAWCLLRALLRANADIYLESPAVDGVVSLFCRLLGRRSILSISSEMDVENGTRDKAHRPLSALAHRLNIRWAGAVVVQSEYQRRMLSQNFRRESVIIKNPFSPPLDGVPEKSKPPLTLWVGTVRPIKQAELFLKLAKAVPQARFQMIGGPALGEEPYFASIKEAAKLIPNLEFSGFIPPDMTANYLAQSSVLVNTSVLEGFPNTFLEAWAHYTPVVSLNADPDDIICRHKLGFHSRSFARMVDNVRTLINDAGLREEMARNGRMYLKNEHDAQKITGQYMRLFENHSQ